MHSPGFLGELNPEGLIPPGLLQIKLSLQRPYRQEHLLSPQLRQVLQPSVLTTAFV